MSNEIKIFEHPEFGSIRAAKQNDEPWFVAADVCKALEIGNPTDAMRRLDADERTLVSIEGASNGLPVNAVNEPGLYTLILGSRKPEAKQFKRWITHDVLPSIRRTGGYIAAKADDTPEEIMARALLIANDTIQRQKKQIEADRPKVSYCDEILRCENAILATTIAKDYGMSAVAFNRKLNELGIQYRRGGTWFLYDKYADKGYTRSETYKYADSDGRNCASVSTKWTQKGRLFLYERLKEAGITPCVEQAS